MALATRYYTVNGTIRAQDTGGGDRSAYLPDALGSVTATTDSRGAAVNTYRYKPYGELLAKSGGAADPKFLWVGCSGYRSIPDVPTYIRARHYFGWLAGWTSTDRLWPEQDSYRYSVSNPATFRDPSGLACASCCCCPETITAEIFAKYDHKKVVYPSVIVSKACPGVNDEPNYASWVGAMIKVQPRWQENATGTPKPTNMGSCTLKWQEWRGYSPKWWDQRYIDWRGHSDCARRTWNSSLCAIPSSTCEPGNCDLYANPGVSAQNFDFVVRNSPTLPKSLEICYKLTLSAPPLCECKGFFGNVVEKYFKFVMTVKKNEGDQVVVDSKIEPSNARCAPVKSSFGYFEKD